MKAKKAEASAFFILLGLVARQFPYAALLLALSLLAGPALGFTIFLLFWVVAKTKKLDLSSPSGDGSLRVWWLRLDAPLFLSIVPLSVWAVPIWDWLEPPGAASDLGSITRALLALAVFPVWLVFYGIAQMFNPLSCLRCVRVDFGGKRKRFLSFAGIYEARERYLWLAADDVDGQERLLIASESEFFYHYFLWTESGPEAGSRFPYCHAILGPYPPLRSVKVSTDHEWLERLWKSHNFDPKSALDFTWKPDSESVAETRAQQVAEFFRETLPFAENFPNQAWRTFASPGRPDSKRDIMRRVCDAIPAASLLYSDWREAALRELDGSPANPSAQAG